MGRQIGAERAIGVTRRAKREEVEMRGKKVGRRGKQRCRIRDEGRRDES